MSYNHMEVMNCTYIIHCGHERKGEANSKVSQPIDHYCDAHGHGARTLREKLGRDHPRYRAGPNAEKDDIDECADDTHVGHPLIEKLKE